MYDNAIVEDLEKSFGGSNSTVKVVSPERIIPIVAEAKDDNITFPIVALQRSTSYDQIVEQTNFTKLKRGIPTTFDTDTNNIYNERSLPINLSYTLSVLTTNQADMDEILRELIFKYTSMYFLSIKIPYESKRVISFGIVIDKSSTIEQKSGLSEYTENGSLYQSSIPLRCEGCVLLHYTPRRLTRTKLEVDIERQ